MIVELHAKSDVGRVRRGNEDNFLVLDLSSQKTWTGSDGCESPEELKKLDLGDQGLVLVVSDGMGGALAGDVASRMAVETVRDEVLKSASEDGETASESPLVNCLRYATEFANLRIHRSSQEEARHSGMGATFTGVAVTPGGVDFVQVGDSRAYIIRGREIRLATKDQSLVQQLVDVGQISEQEAETHMFRNVILQALGAQAELSPVTGRVRLRRDDIILVCSDGLSGKLRAEDMLEIVASSGGDLDAACARLVDEANARGGEDNITVILARFSGDDLDSPDSHKITVELPDLEDDSTFSGSEEETQIP